MRIAGVYRAKACETDAVRVFEGDERHKAKLDEFGGPALRDCDLRARLLLRLAVGHIHMKRQAFDVLFEAFVHLPALPREAPGEQFADGKTGVSP